MEEALDFEGDVKTIWSDVSPTDIAEYVEDIQRRPHFEDLILSYMYVPLAMTVCKKWDNIAVSQPERMRPYKVEFIRTVCRANKDPCQLSRGRHTLVEDTEKLEGFELKKQFEYYIPDIFAYVKFLCTNYLMVTLASLGQLKEFDRNIPSWWKESITKVRLAMFDDVSTDYQLIFLNSFPNLHSLQIFLGGEFRGLPYIETMSSIRNLRFFGLLRDTDVLLEVLCAKSDNLKVLRLEFSVTAKAFIKFLKKANFAMEVHFDTRKFKAGAAGLWRFNAFIRKNAKNYKLADDRLEAEFEFRNTKFFIKDLSYLHFCELDQ